MCGIDEEGAKENEHKGNGNQVVLSVGVDALPVEWCDRMPKGRGYME